MFLIEIGYPIGRLTVHDRESLATSITTGLLDAHEAPTETLARARELTHIWFSPRESWVSGDGPLAMTTEAPPLVITVTVPAAWIEEMSRHLMAIIRAAVLRLDRRLGLERSDGTLWVDVIGVADQNFGLNGRPATASDVLAHLTGDYRAGRTPPTHSPDGVLLDPICGMAVYPGPKMIMITVGDDTIGFCSTACQQAYAREHSAG